MSSTKVAEAPLRQLAEERLRAGPPSARRGISASEELQHELQVHQVELEMQNEALRDAQHDLEVSRERYRNLYELAPVPYLTLKETGKILEANVAASELLGVGRSELSGTHLSKFALADHAERFELHRREVLSNTTQRARVELTLTSADGRPHEVRFESVCTDPRTREWRTAIVDRTEVGEFERQLRQSQRLEVIGTLATGIAHDFNNLLQAILAGAQVALYRLEPGSEARRSLEIVRRAAWRGRSVVRQLHPSASEDLSHEEVTDVNALLDSAAPLARRLLGEDIELRLDLAAHESHVRLDAGQCEQILLNLAKNARQAMPRGGRLSISTATVDTGPTRFVRVEVRDTGSGMDPDTREHAFQAFFTTKAHGKSTGLGLPMVRSIVERAGGSVALTSEVDVGTCVSVDLPVLAGGDKIPSEFPSVFPLPRLGIKAVVVEDEPLARRAVCDYLAELDCDVLQATTAEEALELVRADPGNVRLMVTDIVLPKMAGPDLAELVRKENPSLAIVLTTAHSRETLVERGRMPNDCEILQKPFTAEGLLAAIRAVLRDATTVRPTRSAD